MRRNGELRTDASNAIESSFWYHAIALTERSFLFHSSQLEDLLIQVNNKCNHVISVEWDRKM